ncbi:Vacuolar (H+)-ATPase G subunit [Babesia duncani]|uniref:Vacuolar (H+)-ATPase G subunit n=1 Tax=Babesia duncani TaxID=323732 RepID=A0AAD9UNS1_9APIC|nr:Vacuolar (H+)-ATPase G subunit [Babesia duncani]
MSNNKGSDVLIQQLLKAEEEAEAIVRRAKENRVKLLNEAIAAAEKDLQEYSEREENLLLNEYDREAECDDPQFAELESKSNDFIQQTDLKFKDIKDTLVKRLVDVTLDIKPVLTRSFMQNINI